MKQYTDLQVFHGVSATATELSEEPFSQLTPDRLSFSKKKSRFLIGSHSLHMSTYKMTIYMCKMTCSIETYI